MERDNVAHEPADDGADALAAPAWVEVEHACSRVRSPVEPVRVHQSALAAGEQTRELVALLLHRAKLHLCARDRVY